MNKYYLGSFYYCFLNMCSFYYHEHVCLLFRLMTNIPVIKVLAKCSLLDPRFGHKLGQYITNTEVLQAKEGVIGEMTQVLSNKKTASMCIYMTFFDKFDFGAKRSSPYLLSPQSFKIFKFFLAGIISYLQHY